MGNTAAVLFDLYYGLPDNVRLCESPRLGACIRVVGDVSFADNWKIIPVLEEKGEGIEGVVSPEALSLLRSSDVTLVNNEFTYSTRGAPLANKAYTFRADPGRPAFLLFEGAAQAATVYVNTASLPSPIPCKRCKTRICPISGAGKTWRRRPDPSILLSTAGNTRFPPPRARKSIS